MSPDARKFLNYEFATLSLVAGLATRNPLSPIYRMSVSEEERQRTKGWIRLKLKTIGEQYRAGPISESKHIENIATLAATTTHELGGLLFQDKLRFGVAQKILNLYLKYLWVTDYIAEPPHCPIDGRIAQKAKLFYQWTTSDSQQEYEEAVAALKAGPPGSSIATWELREFEVGRR